MLYEKTQHRPIKVLKRIFDGKDLWGILGEVDNKLSRIGIRDMLGMILQGYTFLVDIKGRDKPAVLTDVHRRSGNQLIFYFRTIGDSLKDNNFNKVEKTTYSYSRRVKLLKV